jgi:hypothetical protein
LRTVGVFSESSEAELGPVGEVNQDSEVVVAVVVAAAAAAVEENLKSAAVVEEWEGENEEVYRAQESSH